MPPLDREPKKTDGVTHIDKPNNLKIVNSGILLLIALVVVVSLEERHNPAIEAGAKAVGIPKIKFMGFSNARINASEYTQQQ